MLSNEKIQIGVEILNNTGPALAKIKSDTTNMAKGMQTSLSSTNTLMTQNMLKASSTIKAATMSASTSASGSFLAIQLSAKESASTVTRSYTESAKTISTEWSQLQKVVSDDAAYKKATDDIAEDNKKLGKAYDYLHRQIWMVIKARQKEAIALEQYHAQMQATLTIYESIKKKSGVVFPPLEKHLTGYRDAINNAGQEAKKAESETTKLAEATKKSTLSSKQHESQLESIVKRFFTLASAIWAVRRAYQAVATSVKLYESQSGMGATGGYARVSAAVGQIGIEIGSVLEPVFKGIAEFMEKNMTDIGAVARQVSSIIISVTKGIGSLISTIQNLIYSIIGSIMTGVMTIYSGIANLINNIVQAVPLIPQAVKKASDQTTKDIDEATGEWVAFTQQAFKDTAQSSEDFSRTMAELFKTLYVAPAASGIKYVTDKQKEALEKRKQDMAAFLAWVAQLQDRYDQTTLSEFDYRRKKTNADAQADKIRLIEWEKSLNLNLNQYKIQIEQLRAAAIDKIDKEELDRKIERINQLEQAQKEAYQAAVSAAKSSGIGSGSIQKTPGSPQSAVAIQAYTGRADIATQVEEMTKAYDMMVETGKFSEEELAQARIDIETNTVNAIKQLDYDLLQSRMQNMQSYVSMFTDVAKSITEIGSNMVQIQMNELNKQTEEKHKSLEDAYDFDTKYVKNKKKLDKSYDDAKNQLAKEAEAKQKELYKKQKGWSIANALIAGAEASMNSWVQAMKLGYPASVIVGGIMQGVIAALTASQVALIGSQKFATGGIVQGPAAGDKVTIQANGGEMMLTMGQQARLYQALNGQGTMGQQVTIAGDTYIVHGNLDKNAADQIIRQKEQRISVLRNDLRELNYRGQLSFA